MALRASLTRATALVYLGLALASPACGLLGGDNDAASTESDSGASGGRCGPEGKTLANRYICLPEGARCAGQTLPCCTDECESNDGKVFNPSDDSSLYLTCDTAADKCVKKSGSSSGGYCGTSKPTTLFSCPPGELQCFINTDSSGMVSGGSCCPPARPYYCSRDKSCYETNADASQACKLTLAPCWHCVEPTTSGGTCDAAGTWKFDCPPSKTACGVCGIIPKGSVSITISDGCGSIAAA